MNLYRYINILLIFLFCSCVANAQEQIVEYTEESLPVLNEELRKSREDIRDITSDISSVEDDVGKVLVSSTDTLDYLEEKVSFSLEASGNTIT